MNKKIGLFPVFLLVFSVLVFPQLRLDFPEQVNTMAKDIAKFLCGIIGLIGFGITAYQFATQHHNPLTTLLYSLVGYGIANFAATLV